ncbi:MAG: DUF1669 domain-containing protein [Spirochaetes bacterium]|nr:DUF1669 domain-containing protein [Spirochaetota bacterium]
MDKIIRKIITFMSLLLLTAAVNEAEISIQPFFTDPQNLSGAEVLPADALRKVINLSEKNIYLALYDLDDEQIADSLVAAKERGVEVRLVTDSDNLFNESVKLLVRNGIEIVSDNRSGLMHDKFILIDGVYLWTGSYNVTLNGNNKNNNNALLIKSQKLYEIYFDEFNEMFEYHIFGNKKDTSFTFKGKNKHYVESSEYKINVFFSPEDDIEKNIIKKIEKAGESINFMAFSFTSDGIGAEMIKAAGRGVEVRGIFEAYGSETEYSEYGKMLQYGLKVKKDSNPAYLHHKVIIIDGEWVLTGSYNFSQNAQKKNDENAIFIKNAELAGKYTKEFDVLYSSAR